MRMFDFKDYAIVEELGYMVKNANVHVRFSENENAPYPGVIVRLEDEDSLLDHTLLLLKLSCRYDRQQGVGKREALSAIGRLLHRRKHYGTGSREWADVGNVICEAPMIVTIHNHDEVGELLLSIAKDLS